MMGLRGCGYGLESTVRGVVYRRAATFSALQSWTYKRRGFRPPFVLEFQLVEQDWLTDG